VGVLGPRYRGCRYSWEWCRLGGSVIHSGPKKPVVQFDATRMEKQVSVVCGDVP
jgi:hypothetical protein